jgi:hypothetical protein
MPASQQNRALVRADTSEEDFDGDTVHENRTHGNHLHCHARRVRQRQRQQKNHDDNGAKRAFGHSRRPEHSTLRRIVSTRKTHDRRHRRRVCTRPGPRGSAAETTCRQDGQRIRRGRSCSRSRGGLRAIAAVVGRVAVRRCASPAASLRCGEAPAARREGHREHHGGARRFVRETGAPGLAGRRNDQRPSPAGPHSDAVTAPAMTVPAMTAHAMRSHSPVSTAQVRSSVRVRGRLGCRR